MLRLEHLELERRQALLRVQGRRPRDGDPAETRVTSRRQRVLSSTAGDRATARGPTSGGALRGSLNTRTSVLP